LWTCHASLCMTASSRTDARSSTPALSNAPALLFAMHIHPLPCAAHMRSQQYSQIPNARMRRVRCTHAEQFFRSYKLLVEPPSLQGSKAPTREFGMRSLPHAHHNSCMPLWCLKTCVPHLTIYPSPASSHTDSHPPLHTIPCHSYWEVTRWGHGKRSPCPVPPSHPPTTREYLFYGGPVRPIVCGDATGCRGADGERGLGRKK
jgi:hypothetical protein